jgi:hypothetical protein
VLSLLAEEPPALTLTLAGERWERIALRRRRLDEVQQRVPLKHALPLLGDRAVDEIAPHDVAGLVVELVAKGKKPGTIRKTVQALFSITRASSRIRRAIASSSSCRASRPKN